MTRRSSGTVSRQMQLLFTAGSFNGLSDRQLLERFVARRDAVAELAFATLVQRHGPMVLGVCRRILADSHDAEDAFQATFLVLVRQAGSIRVDGSLGRWLYGMAMRVAARARANARRRRARERSLLNSIDPASRDTATTAAELDGLQAIVADELGKLPARFYAPIVLCDLECLSHEEAAHLLGCPVGTIKSRLSRARARLRARLIRRGVGRPDLSNFLPVLSATLPGRLVEATIQAARAWTLGRLSGVQIVSASVSALTEGVLWTMLLTKLKIAGAAMLLILAGSAVLVSQATAQRPAASTDFQDHRADRVRATNEGATRDDEVELLMLERAWAEAIPRRDEAVVNRILADDFEGFDPLGRGLSKAVYLADLRSGFFTTQPIVLYDIKTRIFGDFAVVTSLAKSQNVPPMGRVSHVYVRRQNRWLCVAAHGSWTEMSGESNGTAPPAHGIRESTGQMRNDVLLAQRMFPATRSRAVIRPQFECRLDKVYVGRGERVKKGDPLVEVFSTELARHKREYRTKKVQWEHDRSVLQSRQKLVESNIVSQQLLIHAQNHESRSLLEFQIARGKLRFLGLDDDAIEAVEKEEGEQLARLTFRSPIDGTVLTVNARLGNLYDSENVFMLIVPSSSSESRPSS